MKKTVAFLSIVMMLALTFAVAPTTDALIDYYFDLLEQVTVCSVEEGATPAADYFRIMPSDNATGSWVETTEADFSLSYDYMFPTLKYTGKGGALNFRLYLSDTGGMGSANIVGYSYVSMFIATTQEQTVKFGIDEGNTDAMLDFYFAVNSMNELVATDVTPDGITLPAGFIGYVYASLEHVAWQDGSTITRNKQSNALLTSGDDPTVSFDPEAVQRSNNTWTIAKGNDVYFGDFNLVRGMLMKYSDNYINAKVRTGTDINFVVLDCLDCITTSKAFAYTAEGSAADTVSIGVGYMSGDPTVCYTLAGDKDTHIAKIQLDSVLNLKEHNYGNDPVGFGFYLETEDKGVTVGKVVVEGKTNNAASAQILYDMEGNVAATGNGGLDVPANFRGYVFQVAEPGYDWSFGEADGVLIWLSGEEGTTVTFDDFGYFSALADINYGENAPVKTLNFVGMNALEDRDMDEDNFVFAYGEEAPFSSHGGFHYEYQRNNRSIEIAWDKTASTVAKLAVGNGRTVAVMDADAYGFGFYVETGAKPVELIQVAFNGGATYTFATLYDTNGLYCGSIGSGGIVELSAIPADFRGYVCYCFGSDSRAVDFADLLITASAESGAILRVDNFGYYNAQPKQMNLVGVQCTAAEEGTFDVRFVFGIDTLAFETLAVCYNASVDGTPHWGEDQMTTIDKAFATIHVEGMGDISAATLGYKYLIALTIEDVPDEGEIAFEVSGFSQTKVSTASVYSASYTATFNNGAFTGIE